MPGVLHTSMVHNGQKLKPYAQGERTPMSFDVAKGYLESIGLGDRVIATEAPSSTVEEAAAALGCEPEHIAKTMAFLVDDAPVLVLCAGDARVNNSMFKRIFHTKAKMVPGDVVEGLVGHAPGGVCPFGAKDGVRVFLDESLRRFDVVYPACGNDHSGVRLTIPELEQATRAEGWVDVCRGWRAEE